MNSNNKKIIRNLLIYLGIPILLVVLLLLLFDRGADQTGLKYSDVLSYFEDGKVSAYSLNLGTGEMKLTVTEDSSKKESVVRYTVPNVNLFYNDVSDYIKSYNEEHPNNRMTQDVIRPAETSWLVSLIPTLLMIALLVAFWVFMMKRMGGGGAGNQMNFGKAKVKQINDEKRRTTFADVAGADEEKEELREIVEFLKRPNKYNELGARIPKGVLLVGPPGTGKTLLARAVAGEAGVPFFSISGSDFVEMFVGVGASRVRDLFEQAKQKAPCILFIDEIDAVGRKRGAGLGGGHDEREQTLNQLLVEMDGFGENTGIIILAATNRPDILDPALLRPGRFDRQIVIGAPDIKGREEIFRVHSRNKPLADEVDPKVLARRTPGFTPADIENMLNEAALLTARRNGMKIRMDEIEEAITKVIAGPEKKSRVISEEERRLTAFHEAGHAVVAHSLPKTDPVHQITIVPRGRAGGFTMILPKEDKYYGTKTSMREQIIHLLGGRVAEMLTLDDISTGASNDIMRATEIAKDMVTKYGFSDKLGPVNYSSSDEVFLGKDFSTRQNYSEETASEIDEEVKNIVEACFEEAKAILSEHMDKLQTVAEALLEIETLSGEQFELLYSGKMTAQELVADVQMKEDERREKNAAEAEESARLLKEAEEREAREAEAALNNMVLEKQEENWMTEDDEDDDMPSEEELAKYDGDYFADEEDTEPDSGAVNPEEKGKAPSEKKDEDKEEK